MLQAIVPQVAEHEDLVELCVCDNASSDDTWEVLRAAQANGPIRSSRNDVNLGPCGNANRLTNELAQGEYVWVLGDDDLVRPGAVRQVLNALREHRDLDAFYLNFNQATYARHWPDRAPGGYDGPCDGPACSDVGSRRIERWEDLLSPKTSFCTQIYVHVLRRRLWQGYTENGVLGEPYSSFRWTYPHTYMVAKAMFGHPAFFLAEPVLTIFNREAEWFGELPRIVLELLPKLIDFFECLGLDRDRAREFRAAVDAWGVEHLADLMRGRAGGANITALGYVTRNWYSCRTWRLLNRAMYEVSPFWRSVSRTAGVPRRLLYSLQRAPRR